MRLYREKQVRATIPTASMADIAFLLIIFFMLTTSFSPMKTSVDLPESLMRAQVQQDAAIIAVTVDEQLVFSDGEQPGFNLASTDDLAVQIQLVLKAVPNKQFVVKADRMVRYQLVDKVLDELRRNGAKNIGLLTAQRPPTRKG